MLRDVFYFGNKPNAHPREKHALDLADARQKCTTDYFWIINEYNDYRNFDWEFDFEFLADEDVWAEEHINIWPSQHQKDSGTWLCNATNDLPLTIYRADVQPVKRRNEKSDVWKILDLIDESKFDLSWHPDPTDPPYIYKWGCKYYPTQIKAVVEYHVKNATNIKYMDELIDVLPEVDRWKEYQLIDRTKFDLNWRPDPREPAYIYAWGNKYDPAEVKPTLEYHVPGATEYKYMDIVDLQPEWDRWTEVQVVDKTQFDFSWRPNPNLHEPPYIYVWGNKHILGEIKSTLEYHVPGATEYKYMSELVEVLPELDRWTEVQHINKNSFDLSWRPDPREPAYIYIWGNKHISGELQSTIEYHVDGATERKYMSELVEVLPQTERWKIIQEVKNFDFSWRPDPREPAYIYIWGNKHISAELQSTIEYHVPGATEKKYMEQLVDVLPELDRWTEVQSIDKTKFDLSWRPDPREPAYIYVWGNKHVSGEVKSTLEYHMPNATERKYMDNIEVKPEWDRWNVVIPVDENSFDFTWRPDPTSPPYIYVWGNKFHPAEEKPTVEYQVPDATEYKYMGIVNLAPEWDRWNIIVPIDMNSFDFRWRPDPNLYEPPMIYVFGNKWNDSKNEPTIEYIVPNATVKKYMDYPLAIPKIDMSLWTVNNKEDLNTFDFTWRPNPHSPPQIYQWADNGPRYTVLGATEVVLMERSENIQKLKVNRYKIKTTLEELILEHQDEVFWAINPDLSYNKFDFNWRPTEQNFRHINVFGNEYSKNTQTYYVNGPLYMMGQREFNYVEDQQVQVDSNLSMLYFLLK